jgi:hypothetical protein
VGAGDGVAGPDVEQATAARRAAARFTYAAVPVPQYATRTASTATRPDRTTSRTARDARVG